MATRHDQAAEAIKDSWDFWLNEHTPLTLPRLIGKSIEAATLTWLRENSAELLDRVARIVADSTSRAAETAEPPSAPKMSRAPGHRPQVVAHMPFHDADIWCCSTHAEEAAAPDATQPSPS